MKNNVALVECVPNFSEGRRQSVIEAIADAAASAGVDILDVNRDVDHNRSVITFVGEPDQVEEAAYRTIARAADLIDLRQHQGVHPRIGAADVVPFVPLREMTMADCAAMAHRLGARVGSELQLPVYLYEHAALRPAFRNLADVRRGGYEKLAEAIQQPERAPDFGPSRLGSAGAVAIGARGVLIAFNAFLNTSDTQIAQSIASVLRESNGGLPFLKALGLLVNGQAQVSMNIIDYRRTSLHTIIERLRAEAALRGVEVTHTELIGLIPQAALLDYAMVSLGLPPEARERTLEARIGVQSGDYRPLVFE